MLTKPINTAHIAIEVRGSLIDHREASSKGRACHDFVSKFCDDRSCRLPCRPKSRWYRIEVSRVYVTFPMAVEIAYGIRRITAYHARRCKSSVTIRQSNFENIKYIRGELRSYDMDFEASRTGHQQQCLLM